MIPAPSLRPATEVDRETFVAIWKEAFSEALARRGWDAQEERRRADEEFDEAPASIVEVDGRAIGYVSVRREIDHDFVCGVAIAPAWQGRGIGTALLRGAQDDARARGVVLGLSVWQDNRALRLYERLGFRVLRVEPPRVFMEWSG